MNDATGDYYYGSALNLYRRGYAHRSALKRGAHRNPRLQAAWNKYGPESFTFLALCVLERDLVISTEQRLLDSHVGRDACYNVAVSAEAPGTGYQWTAKQKARASASAKRRGISPETRAKIAATLTGRTQCPETIAKRAAKLRGRAISEEQKEALRQRFTGRVFSEETRAKMAAAKRGKRQSPETVARRTRGGWKHTDEWKAMMRAKFAGRSYSPETIERMREGPRNRGRGRA